MLFLAYFLFVWLWINPAIIYYDPGSYLYSSSTPIPSLPDIYTTWSAAFAKVFFYPGEIADYCGAALSRCYALSWLGALIIAVLAWLLSFLTGTCLSRITGGKSSVLRYFPAVIVLAQYLRYEHLIADSLSVLVALLLANIYAALGSLKKGRRYCLLIVLASIAVVVSKGLTIFLILCMIYEIVRQRSFFLALLEFLSCAVFPIIFSLITGNLNLGGALQLLPAFAAGEESLPLQWTLTLKVLLYGSVPLAVLADLALSKFLTPELLKGRKFYKFITVLITLAVTGFFLDRAYSPLARNQLFLNYYLYTRQWDRLLREAAQRPIADFNDFHSHIVDRALFHQGRLLDDLLRFPQSQYSLFLSDVPELRQQGTVPQMRLGRMDPV